MATEEDDFFADVPKYEGKVYEKPTFELGQRSDQEPSIRNYLLDYGWVAPAVGIPIYGAAKGYEFYKKNFGAPPKDTGGLPPGGNPPDDNTPPGGGLKPKNKLQDRFLGMPNRPPSELTSIEQQLGDLDINSLPKDQRETVNTLIDAERKRIARQQEAQNVANDYMSGKIPIPENTKPTFDYSLTGTSVKPIETPATNVVPEVKETPPTPPVGVSPETTEAPKVETKKKIGRRTNAENEALAAERAALNKEAPPGWHVPIPKKKKSDEMGPGAFNYLASQYGPEEAARRWEETYGKKNVPYAQFEKDWMNAHIGPIKGGISPETVKGGSVGTPKYVPEYIKGFSNVGGLLGALGSGALMYAATTPQAQAAMQRAGAAIKDIGISPDLLQGKGEELGRLGSAYVTAGNPQYRQQLLDQIRIERDPQRYQMLLSEFKKAGGNVPGGRGAIAPPQ